MNNPSERTYWRRCSTCKNSLEFNQKYWVCNVSTCNRKRTGLVFCTVECWDAHVPLMNHRESWAEERVAPTAEAALRETEEEPKTPEKSGTHASKAGAPGMKMGGPLAASAPRRVMVSGGTVSAGPTSAKETLVVVSKVKDFIRVKSEMNTSQSAMDVLSDFIRAHCEDAIQRAREEGRKTVLDRDFHWKGSQ